MRHQEFYSKYKINYPPPANPLFSMKNWWRILLITAAAVMIEPFLVYKHQRYPFSVYDYLKLAGYFLAIIIPFVGLLLWANWRDSIKRTRGYVWIGKFEVVAMHTSFLFYYLLLSPGGTNKIKVDRDLFMKIRVGDQILIKRDALGAVEEVSKVNNSGRIAKSLSKRDSNTVA